MNGPRRQIILAVGLALVVVAPLLVINTASGPAFILVLSFPLSALGGSLVGYSIAQKTASSTLVARIALTMGCGLLSTYSQPVVVWWLSGGSSLSDFLMNATPIAIGLALGNTLLIEGVRTIQTRSSEKSHAF